MPGFEVEELIGEGETLAAATARTFVIGVRKTV